MSVTASSAAVANLATSSSAPSHASSCPGLLSSMPATPSFFSAFALASSTANKPATYCSIAGPISTIDTFTIATALASSDCTATASFTFTVDTSNASSFTTLERDQSCHDIVRDG